MSARSQHVPALRDLINDQLFSLDDSVTGESDLFAEGLDSMALMQLIMLMEQEFGFTLTPEDLNRDYFESLADLSELVTRKLAA
jgi:acyl carrier protein